MTRFLCVLLLTTAAASAQQVSLDIQSTDGTDTVTAEPGIVALTLVVRVDSDIDLDGVQFGIVASEPNLFVYGPDIAYTFEPMTETETTFTEADFLGAIPADGTPLADLPAVGLFTLGDPKPFGLAGPVTILTIGIRSAGELPEGSYVFITGDPGFGYSWSTSGGDGPVSADFVDPGALTLIVEEQTTTDPDDPDAGEDDTDGDGGSMENAFIQGTGVLVFLLIHRWLMRLFG